MTELTIPYINTELHSRIILHSNQINSDFYIHLKNNLKKKVEQKCNKFGYITKIYKILEHDDGDIPAENFNGSALYNLKYSCRLCIPQNDTHIICKINMLNKSLITAVNGPILCIIKLTEINNENFTINNKGDLINNSNNKPLINENHIIVKVMANNFFAQDDRIIILGYLNSIASSKEIVQYFNENFEIEEIEKSEDF